MKKTESGAKLKFLEVPLSTLEQGFEYIEKHSFDSSFQGLFSEINLSSEKLGKTYEKRNEQLCKSICEIARKLDENPTNNDTLGAAYEYLIGQFAAGSGKKAGEFYTPQPISDVLSGIVSLDAQNPASGTKDRLDKVLDFACGSGSLLLNLSRLLGKDKIGTIYAQEKTSPSIIWRG